MGNFMRAYTIAFETDNGERVASRSIVSFFKRVEEILEESPENVIRRINGKLMRVHAYEWNHMNDNYVVVPIGKLKEKTGLMGAILRHKNLLIFLRKCSMLIQLHITSSIA